MPRKDINIDEEKLDWIQSRYGDDVSLTWYINQLIEGQMRVDAKGPADYSEIARKELGDPTEG